MKRSVVIPGNFVSHKSVCLFVGCAALVGCSRQTAPSLQPPKGAQQKVASTQPPAAPEVVITKLETSQERANYLRELGRDSAFEPQKHVEMLQQFTNDSDRDVAIAAQELLDRK